MAGKRADRLLFEIVRTINDGGVVVAAVAAHCGQHHGVKNRTGAGDAAGVAQRGAVEVADPDADGDGARVADGPVVVVGLRGAGLDRDRERKIEIAAAAENEFARVRVAEDVRDPEGGALRNSSAWERGRLARTFARERR